MRHMHHSYNTMAPSFAAYNTIMYHVSLISLQIKDRHDGNIMLTADGRLVHIDYGFMLSNAPGGVHFEVAPWKLTREMMEIMGSDSEGRASEMFDYYKVGEYFQYCMTDPAILVRTLPCC